MSGSRVSVYEHVRARTRWVLLFGIAALAGLLSLGADANAAGFAAKASLTQKPYYVGDATGSSYSFTVTNNGTTTNIGAVEIRRPNMLWTVVGCPVAPAGWMGIKNHYRCEWRSASGTSDDIKPGQSRTFVLRATTLPGTEDHLGTWSVKVSSGNNFAVSNMVKLATTASPGLTAKQQAFQLTQAVVSDTAKTPGSACPPSQKNAVAGSSKTIVICGRNRAKIALTPLASYSSLGGTFVKTPGTFQSAAIAAKSGDVVLANWNGTVVTDALGSGKTVVAKIGSQSNRTSKVQTFTQFGAFDNPPVANADTYTTDEDTPLSVPATGVLGNDTDPDGQALTAQNASDPAHGSVTLSTDGSFTYTPDADFAGSDSFTYQAHDGYALSSAATVTITVTPVNDAPVALGATETTAEDTPKNITLPVSDADGDPLTYAVDSSPAHGSVVIGTNGVATYTPGPDFAGTDSFTYHANDGALDSTTETVDITVTAVNDAPVANGDGYTTNEDQSVVVSAPGVLGNDTDVESDPLTAAVVASPAHGSVVFNPNGSFLYTPDPDFNGSDSFTYKANDGMADSDTAVVSINVHAANDAPLATDVNASTNEDTPKPVTLTATDVDGDPLTYAIVSGPTHGSLGTVTGNSVTYTPDPNFHDTDSFTFRASDGTANSNTATVNLTVTPVNDAPAAAGDSYSTDEDQALVVSAPGLLANDSDVEGDSLTATKVASPAHGSVTVNADGSFTYTPAANYNGTDSFTYTANDGTADSSTAVVDITVNPVNDLPVADAKSATTAEDTQKAIQLSGSDAVEQSDVTFSLTDTPDHGSLSAITNVQCAAGACSADITYTPDANFHGSDSFAYKANDGTGDSTAATVSITVTSVNDAPTATDDAYSTDEDQALTVTAPGVLDNDSDVDSDPLTATTLLSPGHGSLTLNADGSFLYTPTANFEGTDVFTYKANDGTADTNTATVTITVNAVNDLPVADAKSATTGEDTGKAIQLAGSDAVEHSDLTFSVVTPPTHGSLSAITNTQCTAGACTADITYTPDANYNGTDSFTYKANDGTGDSTAATVSITITAVNDAPSFTKGANDTVVQDTGARTVTGWATAISPGPADESAQTVTFHVSTDATPSDLFAVAPDVDETTGNLTYTPAAGKTGTATVSIHATDNGGTADGGDDTSDTQTFTITVRTPNNAPVADSTSGGTDEDNAVVLVLTGSDADDDNLTFVAGTASHGTVGTPTAADCSATNTCTSTVTYTPDADYNGPDSFTFKVNDTKDDSPDATVSVTIDPVNDAPSFTKGANQTVNEDAGAQTADPWATAVSEGPSDEVAQDVTFHVSTDNDALFSALPAVSPSGVLTYTPAVDGNGSTTVSVYLTDNGTTANGGDDESDVQTFTITVNAVNDVPSFTKGADETVNEDAGAQSVSNWATAISKGPGDESAQALNFVVDSNSNPSLFSSAPVVSATGTLTYTPAANKNGTATVGIYLHDNGGTANGGDDSSDVQTFTITVNAVNDAPSFTKGGNQTVNEDAGAQTIDPWATAISAGPSDENAQAVTLVASNDNTTLFSSQPAVSSTGVLTYTPAANAFGSATVTVYATDDGGTLNSGDDTSDSQTFTITVAPVNDEPSFTKGSDGSVLEDAGAQSVSNWASAISKGPANESGQTVHFVIDSNDNTGLFSSGPAVSPTGTLTYTSAANKYGTANITLHIEDDGGTANGGDNASPTQSFAIVVMPVNDAPVAQAKSFTVQSNMKISLGGLLTGAQDTADTSQEPSYTPEFTVHDIVPGAGCIGCTVSNVNAATGTFDFDPPAGGTGTYTLTYRIDDTGFPSPGATSAAATVTFTVNGPVIWFVDTAAGAGGTGRLSAPFNTLPPATSAMSTNTNQRIFVKSGNVSGNVTLPTDGWLISDAATDTDFDSLMDITPPAGTIARPVINGTQRSLSGSVTLGDNSVVRGFDLTPSSGTKGLVGSGATGVTVNQMSITTTNARAVDLSTSAGVISLTSVSATGADRGISLSSVNVHDGNGETGSFTITGSGTAGSGGTLNGSTAVGATEANLFMSTVENVSLSRMVIQNGTSNGIYGSAVETFAIDNSTVSGNGSDHTLDHSGVKFANLNGTSTMSSVTVTGSREHNVFVENSSGTGSLTVSNSTISSNNPTVGANGLYVNNIGTSVYSVTSTNNTFTSNRLKGLVLFSQGSGKLTASVNGGSYTQTSGTALDIANNGTGGLAFTVTGGTVTGCAQPACGVMVNVFKGSSGTGTGASALAGTVSGMAITNANNTSAPGIWVHGVGAGEARVAVINNTVSQVAQYGIHVLFGENTAGTLNAQVKVANNVVSVAGSAQGGGLPAIVVESAVLSTDLNVSVCAEVTGNQATNPDEPDIYLLTGQAGGTIRLPGYGGLATDTTAAANYVKGLNPTTTNNVMADRATASPGFLGGSPATCTAP